MRPDDEHLIDDGGFQRELHQESSPFFRGQHIIWLYRPQRRRSEVHCVAAVVAQVSELRIRVRARSVSGKLVLRWVHARNLRAIAPGEAGEPYPELS